MNKVALITGSTRGIGKALSIGLAKNGYNIVITGKTVNENHNLPGTIYSVANEVEKEGVKALPILLDVRDERSVINMFKTIKSKFNRLDIIINNAGGIALEIYS